MISPLARQLMQEFAAATGLTGEVSQRRYLWTDSFAVCNYLGFHRETGDRTELDLAEKLIRQVHHVLGRHRTDDSRTGWISGLSEEEGQLHPTRGGLRIGKKMNERSVHEIADSRAEWDRDGQYFHYLTKWMHALKRAHQETANQEYLDWAAELAIAAHRGFMVHRTPTGPPRMVWKMSIDLSRPLVESMGHHDPLEGLITALELLTAGETSSSFRAPLQQAAADYRQMCEGRHWATDDSLGIGGLLDSLLRLLQIDPAQSPGLSGLLSQLLSETDLSLRAYVRSSSLSDPPEYRLAFRELGLSIGLRGLELIVPKHGFEMAVTQQFDVLRNCLPLADQIEAFWSEPRHRRTRSWVDHADINSVMLATSLAPAGYFGPRLD